MGLPQNFTHIFCWEFPKFLSLLIQKVGILIFNNYFILFFFQFIYLFIFCKNAIFCDFPCLPFSFHFLFVFYVLYHGKLATLVYWNKHFIR